MFPEGFFKGDLHVAEMYDMHKLSSVDRLLFQILRFFRIVTGNINKLSQLQFDDNAAVGFRYNGQSDVIEDTWVDIIPQYVIDGSHVSRMEYEQYASHIAILQHLLKRRNGAFMIAMTSVSVITIMGISVAYSV